MRLVIVDDHLLVRKGLVSILSNEQNIKEIKEAAEVEEALKIINEEKPDLAMIDLKLGREDGLQVVMKGREASPGTKFVILTSFISREDFLRAERIGIDGYILKEAFAEDILYAISIIRRGKKYYDPGVVDYKNKGESFSIFNELTDREKDVLRELGKGMSNEEIAKKLYISENTVKKHVSSILAKLNMEHRAQVVHIVNSNDTL